MKNRYEALLVLNAQGTEDTIKDIIDRLESEFKKEAAEIEHVQKMDKRQFSYVAGPLDSGHYVNFIFQRADIFLGIIKTIGTLTPIHKKPFG